MMANKDASRRDIYLPEPAALTAVEKLTEQERLFEFKLDSGKELGHKPGQFVEERR